MALKDEVAALKAELAELRASTPVAPAPVARSKDGRDFPCTAEKPCPRAFRSATRAAIHGVEAGGHEARY